MQWLEYLFSVLFGAATFATGWLLGRVLRRK